MIRLKNALYKIFVKDWSKRYPIIIASFSAIFTGCGWYSQHKAADNYEKNTRQVIINSTELANYQIDVLIGKVGNAPRVPITPDNLAFQVNSLEQNLSVIRDVQITNLPKNESMNYQTYRQDLSDTVYKLKSDINGLREQYNVKDSDVVPLSEKDKSNLLHALIQLKYVMEQDNKLISKDKNLYDAKYRKFVIEFDNKNQDFINSLIEDDKNHDINKGYDY